MTVQSSTAVPPRMKYLGLQVMRFVAAFTVLITHNGFYVSERLVKGFPYWKDGAAGVDIFFVLSGFVMVYSSTKLFADAAGWKIFAERRLVRIVPIYWLATTFKVLVLLFSTGVALHATLKLSDVLASYFFLPAYNSAGEIAPLLGVGWTLNFEMLFYFIFALALFFRTNVYRFAGIILALLAAGAFIRQPGWPAASFYLSILVLEFFYGMLIAQLCIHGRRLPFWPALVVLLVSFISVWLRWSPLLWAHNLLHGIMAALVIYATASLEPHLTRIPKILLYLGDATYAIYLFHPLIAPGVPTVFARLHLQSAWLSIICGIVISVAAGSLIHTYVEDPITRFLRDRVRIGGRKIIHLPDTVNPG